MNYTGATIYLNLYTVNETINDQSVQWVLKMKIKPGYSVRDYPWNPQLEGQSFFNFKWEINNGTIQPDGTYIGYGNFGNLPFCYLYWSDTYGESIGFTIIPFTWEWWKRKGR